MNLSLETLLQRLVWRGNALARQTPNRSDERAPTSIRLHPRTRHFLEMQAEALNTSMQSVISMILDGVSEATTDTTNSELRAIRERFLLLAEAHDLTLPEIVDLMKDFGFTLSALSSTDRLLDLLTVQATEHLANVFHVDKDWLRTAKSGSAYAFPFYWYKNLGTALRRLLDYRDAGLSPTVILLKPAGVELSEALYKRAPERPDNDRVGIVIRLRASLPSGKTLATYDVWRFEPWSYEKCRYDLKMLIAFCEEVGIHVVGHDLSADGAHALENGHQLPVTLLSRLGSSTWSPDDYASMQYPVTAEPEEWYREGSGVLHAYKNSYLSTLALEAGNKPRQS